MAGQRKSLHLFIVAILGIVWTCVPIRAESAVYQKAIKSTCWIVTPLGNNKNFQGTGWVVDKERRQVLTNDHVVAGKKEVTVYFPILENGNVVTQSRRYKGTGISAKVLKVDGKRDLALLQLSKLPAAAQTLRLADKSPEVGQAVYSIGNSSNAGKPLFDGSLWHQREGKVSRVGFVVINLTNTGGKVEARTVETSSGTRPGDSGGPLVDDQGRLIGVVSSGIPGSEVSNVIDVQEVRGFLREYRGGTRKTASPLEGNWTVSFTNKGKDSFMGLTVQPKGKLVIEGAAKSWTGTYAYENGIMQWEVPGMNIREQVILNWENNNVFRFTSGTMEFVCTRR
jgi:S1-C subfamily serine protease